MKIKSFLPALPAVAIAKAGIVLLALLGFSCQKDNNVPPGYDMVFQQPFTIPAGIGIFDVHHFQIRKIPSNWGQYLDQHGKTDADISGVITSHASLGGIFGDADLSVIDRISVRVYDESNPNDYLEIAYRDPTPLDSGNVLPMVPSLADSKRFFSATRFSADVVIWLRRTTTEISEVRLDLTMRAKF